MNLNAPDLSTQKERRFTLTETLVFSVSVSLMILSFLFQTKRLHIVRGFFEKSAPKKDSFLVGNAIQVRGDVYRMKAQDAEFLQIENQVALEMDDTLLTGPNGSIEVELKDGQKISVGPNTLVKLSFQADFWLTGIIQRAIVQVKTPEKPKVKVAEEKRPEVRLFKVTEVLPPNNELFTFTAKEYLQNNKTIPFSVKTNQPAPRLSVSIQGKTEIQNFVLEEGGSTYEKTLNLSPAQFNPGKYQIEIRNIDGELVHQSVFSIAPDIQMIEPLETLGSNNKLIGMAAKQDFEGFLLRWNKVEGEANYKVKVFDSNSNKVLVQSQPHSNKLVLNPNKLILGKMYYVVEKTVPFGFRAFSDKAFFGFAFLAPQLTSPAKDATFDSLTLSKSEKTIFFTWTKTNYTNTYEFELSTNRNFEKTFLKKTLRDNFHTVVAPPAGTYYWRVRSNAAGMLSAFSEVRTLKVSDH